MKESEIVKATELEDRGRSAPFEGIGQAAGRGAIVS